MFSLLNEVEKRVDVLLGTKGEVSFGWVRLLKVILGTVELSS